MKKLLLATTVLAGTAGFAAAEVAITGSAEMGIWSNTDGDLAFWQDVEVNFGMSGTTDGGLEFGAEIDLDESNVATGDDSGTTVYVKGAFGKLTMGDTDGALDFAVQDAGSLTSLADDHTTHVAYFSGNGMDSLPILGQAVGQDGQIARYDNTIGAVSFAISVEQVGNGADNVSSTVSTVTPTVGGNIINSTSTSVSGETIWGIGLKYTADLGGTAVTFGVGHQQSTGELAYWIADHEDFHSTTGDVSATGVSLGAELAGGFSAMVAYTTYDLGDLGNMDQTGIGLTYTSGALAVHANYGQVDPDTDLDGYLGNASSYDSYGVAVNYDLGGGAKVEFGYASDMSVDAGDQDQWSLGLGMSF